MRADSSSADWLIKVGGNNELRCIVNGKVKTKLIEWKVENTLYEAEWECDETIDGLH